MTGIHVLMCFFSLLPAAQGGRTQAKGKHEELAFLLGYCLKRRKSLEERKEHVSILLFPATKTWTIQKKKKKHRNINLLQIEFSSQTQGGMCHFPIHKRKRLGGERGLLDITWGLI